jgi:hypothetical protein
MDPHLSQDGYARAIKLADYLPATSRDLSIEGSNAP